MIGSKPKTLKATVTHLEMTARPRTLPPLPVNVSATLVRATGIPLHFYRYLQWQVGHQWIWVERLRMDDKALASIVHDTKTRIYVLSVDGAPAGFFELRETRESTVELSYFGLMAHAIGRGLGEWMLGQAISLAFSFPASRVTVNTNTLDHPAALPLYQRMGFSPVSQTTTIVRPLSDDEILKALKT